MQQYGSLQEALNAHKIPVVNHDRIRRITESIGIAEYWGTTGYIKAVRSGDGPDLNIAYGFTNGFTSRDEAEQAAGTRENGAEVWESDRVGTWGVDHPERGHRNQASGNSTTERDYGTCDLCFTARSASGDCAC